MKRYIIPLLILLTMAFCDISLARRVGTTHYRDNADIILGSRRDWIIECDQDGILEIIPDAQGNEIRFASSNSDSAKLTWYSDTSGDTVTFDEENIDVDFADVDLDLDDDAILRFGSSDDITLQFDGTDFLIDAIVASEGLKLGDTATGFDLTYYFKTAGQFRTDYDGDFINLTDDMELRFGTGASSNGDLKISSNSSNVLQIEQVVADTGSIEVGIDANGIDFKLYADTTGDYVLWDESDEDVKFVGTNLVLDSDSAIENPVVLVTDANTYAVTTANSGKVHVIRDLSQNTSITLPAEASGLYYKFIYVGGVDESDDHTIDSENNTNYFIGGVAFADTDAGAGADEINAGVYSNGSTNSKLTINNASAGTVVEIYCDGTNWYVSGRVFADTAPAFTNQ